MATSGQTLNDRINAARYALAGQGVARCVCKATTEEILGPKKKHLDYLLACTHEPNVSIPQLANLLIERTKHNLWVVVFKALVTVHHLMSNGNERFFQYVASSNYSFELSTFLDKTLTRDFAMSTYIRRYSRYINEKALSYRTLAFDFCKVKRGKEGVLRLMPIEKLLKTLPILQDQLDALLEFDCSANDLNNGIITACFMLLFKDLIGLYACHNDGIINLLEKYFSLNKRMCREAFELYKKFLIRMDKVSDFLRVAEAVGIDKDDIPDIRRTPNSLIDALEQHLLNLESNKKLLKQQTHNNNQQSTIFSTSNNIGCLTPPTGRRPTSPATSSVSHNHNNLNNNNNNNNTTNNNNNNNNITNFLQQTSKLGQHSDESGGLTMDSSSSSSFKDDEVRKALEEEARVLSQYGSDGMKNPKSNKSKSKSSSNSNNQSSSASTLVLDSSPINHLETIPKVIGLPTPPATALISTTTTISNNPLTTTNPSTTTTPPTTSIQPNKTTIDDIFGDSDSFGQGVSLLAPSLLTNSLSSSTSVPGVDQSIFKSGTSTANYTNIGVLDGFGEFLQPATQNSSGVGAKGSLSKPQFASTNSSSGLFKGDLDSTLASLAQNLTFDGLNKSKK